MVHPFGVRSFRNFAVAPITMPSVSWSFVGFTTVTLVPMSMSKSRSGSPVVLTEQAVVLAVMLTVVALSAALSLLFIDSIDESSLFSSEDIGSSRSVSASCTCVSMIFCCSSVN